jgi:hypothetical protein
MFTVRDLDSPNVQRSDALASALRLHGVFHDKISGESVEWKVHRTPGGFALFVVQGSWHTCSPWVRVGRTCQRLISLWACPSKVSAGASSFILSIADSSAAWIYINMGALIAMIAAPSVIGMMLGRPLRRKTSLNRTPVDHTSARDRYAGRGRCERLLRGFGVWI